jgi:hypothetical protein
VHLVIAHMPDAIAKHVVARVLYYIIAFGSNTITVLLYLRPQLVSPSSERSLISCILSAVISLNSWTSHHKDNAGRFRLI